MRGQGLFLACRTCWDDSGMRGFTGLRSQCRALSSFECTLLRAITLLKCIFRPHCLHQFAAQIVLPDVCIPSTCVMITPIRKNASAKLKKKSAKTRAPRTLIPFDRKRADHTLGCRRRRNDRSYVCSKVAHREMNACPYTLVGMLGGCA